MGETGDDMTNGLETHFVIQNNKKLRCGYTTGSCAAGAAKAATRMLLTGKRTEQIDLMTPKGILLHLEVLDITQGEEEVSCAIRKDGGDDPDATHGLLIYGKVKKIPEDEIRIFGGTGVGRVTKKGLEQPVGEAAINRVPRQMIRQAIREICQEEGYSGGIQVEISVPGGEKVAEKTFNPRLGIVGGISILGTSGIVVPMSEAALVASIRLEMEMRCAEGRQYLLITPGNYGADFVREGTDLPVETSMKCSNYVGETLDMAVELGVKGILFVAHIGKFIKVAGGIMNTHPRNADARAELMGAFALRAGADLDTVRKILETITTEEAVEILKQADLLPETMELIAGRIHDSLQRRCGGAMATEAILFSNQYGYLGETKGAKELISRLS
jgi:cobalt-precorrin-5B (C1)-methyltransferase